MILSPTEFYDEEQAYNMDISYKRLKYDLERIRLARTPDEQETAQRDLAAAQHEMQAGYLDYLLGARAQGKEPLALDAVLTMIRKDD